MAATTLQSSQYQHHNTYYNSGNGMDAYGNPIAYGQEGSLNGWPAAADAFSFKQHNANNGTNGGTTAAISSAFGTTGYGNSNMMRTDVFPFLASSSDDADYSRTPAPSMPTSFLGYQSGTTATGTTGTTGLDVNDTDVTNLDFSSSFAAPNDATAWSNTATTSSTSTTGVANNNTTGVELPSLLSLHREDSLVGKAIGFEALASEIDAAPAPTPSTSLKTPAPSPKLFDTAVPYAFDVAPVPAASPSGVVSAAMNEFGSLNFDFTFPGLGEIIGAIPSSSQAATVPSSGVSVGSVDSDMEPDASSVTDVDAVSDVWSVSSGPSSPMHPNSPITRMTRSPVMASLNAVPAVPNPNAALALRPGPYTRGRAAALAAPSVPRELKPVPVARGPHAGLLGGGEMATVGIYTKDDRWRKIERLREKRRARIVVKSTGGQYACRKSFADRRPRIGGRFVKMDDETKRYLSLTKPGVTPPVNITPPPALRAYAAVQATQHVATDNQTNDEYNSQLAAAAQAASQSTASMPLFGHSTATLPPAPSWPAPAVNTTSHGQWYSYPNVSPSA